MNEKTDVTVAQMQACLDLFAQVSAIKARVEREGVSHIVLTWGEYKALMSARDTVEELWDW